jgi:CRP/FNR family transcriptional regulator, nitrogen fixation regulation protein
MSSLTSDTKRQTLRAGDDKEHSCRNASIAGVGIVRSYARKSQIVRENDLAEHIYEVISGTVCTWSMSSDGRRQIAGFYIAGDVFGFENAKHHSLTAQAITAVKVRVVKKQVLNALVSSDVKVAQQLLSLTAVELARQQELHMLLCRPALERVIHFLIDMAQRSCPNEDDLIALPMHRQDIADYLGLTIETVSRMLSELERRGAIKIKGRHTVMLCGKSANARVPTKELRDFFEGVNGRRPKTDQELNDWLASPEGKAATLFDLTSGSRWGERARS